MEKRGMVGGRNFFRTGLLIMKGCKIIFFLLAVNIAINAQEAGPANDNRKVSVQISYETSPVAGKPWVLTLTIDYPDPEGVTVTQPAADFLSLERIVKSPRLTGARLQTVVDYRFIPNKAGRFTLGSFAVICSSGFAVTEPVILNIRAENEEQRPLVLSLVWEGVPSKLETGERAVLSLVSDTYNPRTPSHGFFTPEVPAGIILSSLQLTEQERKDGVYAAFELIPLAGGNIYLPSRRLQFENTVYEIPALRITAADRPVENTAKISKEDAAALTANEESILFSAVADKNNKQRIIRLIFFYSVLFFVIISMFVCLYLLLNKK